MERRGEGLLGTASSVRYSTNSTASERRGYVSEAAASMLYGAASAVGPRPSSFNSTTQFSKYRELSEVHLRLVEKSFFPTLSEL